MPRSTKTISICLPPVLHEWIRRYAFENHTTVSATIQQMILAKAREEGALNAVEETTSQSA